MPAYLPASWTRLIYYLEQWGVNIPRKDAWARVIKRSFENVSYANGLVYIDPQKPYVGYGYHDNIAVTGYDLMTSLVMHRGFVRAAELFKQNASLETLSRWNELADGMKNNIWRLFDKEISGFAAGSKDCHQFDVWANGLAYTYVTDEKMKKTIGEFYIMNKTRIFKYGFTRQIAEETGWQRLLGRHESPVGIYMNGGFWATGTGYVLPALADIDQQLAGDILKDLLSNLPKYHYTEWVDMNGKESDAKRFLMAIALPMLGIKSLLENKPLIEYF